MTRKIIGGVLLALGLTVAVVLLSYGGAVFPHIIGPTVAIVVGAVLFLSRRKHA